MPSAKRPYEADAADHVGLNKMPKLQSAPTPSTLNPAVKAYIDSVIAPYQQRIETLESQLCYIKKPFGEAVMDMGGLHNSEKSNVGIPTPEEQTRCIKRHFANAVIDMGGFNSTSHPARGSTLPAVQVADPAQVPPISPPLQSEPASAAPVSTARASNTITAGDVRPDVASEFAKAMLEKVTKSIVKESEQLYNQDFRSGTNTDDFAKKMQAYVPKAQHLADCEGGVPSAFDLFMKIAKHAYGGIDHFPKGCGYGDSKGPFQRMDEAMLPVAKRRVEESCDDNTDWAVTALKQLKNSSTYLGKYGVDGYFPKTIEYLQKI